MALQRSSSTKTASDLKPLQMLLQYLFMLEPVTTALPTSIYILVLAMSELALNISLFSDGKLDHRLTGLQRSKIGNVGP